MHRRGSTACASNRKETGLSNVMKFEELLRSSEELQAKLRSATEAFAGDKTDEQAVFEAIIAPLAEEAGLPFTYDEAKALAEAGTSLDDEELEAAVGGGETWGGQPESSCIFIGLGVGGDACSSEHGGAGACLGLGIGFLGF